MSLVAGTKNFQLHTPLSRLKGVGEITARHLRAAGLNTVRDLLMYFPRRYDDFSQLKPINQLRPGLVSLRARVDLVKVRSSFKRRSMVITEAIVSDQTGSVKLTWFNSPWILEQIKEGDEYFFLGELKYAANSFGITQPNFERVEKSKLAGQIVPIYPETQHLHSRLLRDLVDQVLSLSEILPDLLPANIREQYELVDYGTAIKQLHQPSSAKTLQAAQQRMAFEELFMHIAASLAIKQAIATEKAHKIVFDEAVIVSFVSSLPFQLTDGQRVAAWQIFSDLAEGHPMNRLLEGDVGSGKTVVAIMAALLVVRAGYQVAIMVPTDILARQHVATFRSLLKDQSISCELLVSKLPVARKRDVRERLADGQLDIVIGTQALITKDTSFAQLGLVVVDEQHRFGVMQRLNLKDKAGHLPHVLTMTATPIPRSLALVIYGDLDISILPILPQGRKPITTKVAFDDDRTQIYTQLDSLIEAGSQIYVVCPAIDLTDEGSTMAATAEHARLSKGIFANRRVGLVHGRLKTDEKTAVMEQFVAGDLDILVATTVIEVGVHVERANAIVIEQAHRFGLASLHQLRGRVGRGQVQAFCYLMTNKIDEAQLARVRAVERTTDGFRLAQIDLETRGSGQRVGTMQSGLTGLQFAQLEDSKLIAEVREAAKAFLIPENIVQYPHTIERINTFKTVTSLD